MTLRFVTTGDDLKLPASTVAPAAHTFRAMRHATAGNTTEAAYWYDRAENDWHKPIRIDATVAIDGLDGCRQRIPAVEKLDDGNLIVMWQQFAGNNDGQGVRLVYAFADYDLAAGTMTVGSRAVFEEPAGWASGLGAAMHPVLIKLPADATTHPGRLICLYNNNDNPDGTVANRWLNIYETHSDDGGATWSARVKVHDAPGATDGRYAALGTCGTFIRIPSGVNEGRILTTVYAGVDNQRYTLYSDDDGVTWETGAPFVTTGYTSNEWGAAWRLDGTLIGNFRYTTPGDEIYATSDDDGETWTFQGIKDDWPTTTCARATLQASTNPDDGYSKILWSGLSSIINNERKGLVLRVSHDGGLTYQVQYRPVPATTAAGYSDLKMIDQNTFVCAWESGFNTTCDVYLYIANMAEVYTNGTHTLPA